MSELDRQWLKDKQELELELKNNSNTNKAVKAFTKRSESPPRVISKYKKTTMISGTPQAIADLDLRDLAFEQQSNEIANSAIIPDYGFTPTKIKSSVTQEMIDDYHARQNQPVVIAGVTYKYHPVEFDLEEFVPKPVMSKDYEAYLGSESNTLIIEIKQYETNIEHQTYKKEVMKTDYDLKMGELEYKKREAENFTKKTEKTKKLKYINEQQTKLTKDYESAMKQIDKAIESDQKNIRYNEESLSRITVELERSVENIKYNEDEEYRVRSTNADKFQKAEYTLKTLGADIERNAGESDEQYRERLIAQGQIKSSPEDEANNVNLENFGIAKRNILQLISSGSKAETVAKSLNNVERFEFNKKFPAIKKKFLETYGFDNKNINERDIVTFIKEFDNTFVIGQPKVIAEQKVPEANNVLDIFEGNVLEPQTSIPVTIGTPISQKQNPKNQLIKIAQDNGLVVDTRSTILTLLIDLKVNHVDLRESNPQLYSLLRTDQTSKFEEAYPEKKVKGSGLSHHRKPLHEGIHTKEYPSLIRFGKIHISPDKLYYKNILAIKNGLKRNYVGIPEKKVSDALASTLMKIVDGGSIKKSDLHVLSPNDKHIYDKLMIMSGLHKMHDHTFDESSKEMKARLRLIEGEISSGNDNIDLLKEAHQLLHSMARSGIISNYSAANHYRHLQSFF